MNRLIEPCSSALGCRVLYISFCLDTLGGWREYQLIHEWVVDNTDDGDSLVSESDRGTDHRVPMDLYINIGQVCLESSELGDVRSW
jgi:hypothetical protein